jgi:lipopolysaccharide export LptBFGC system permease protein LptF
MRLVRRQFLRQAALAAAALTGMMIALIVGLGFVANVDEFVQIGAATPGGWTVGAAAAIQAAAGFYGPVGLLLLVYFGHWGVLGAVMLVIAQMTRRRELAILPASGASIRRVAWWAMLLGAAGQAGLATIHETAVPHWLPQLAREEADVKRGGAKLTIELARAPEGWLISGTLLPSQGLLEPFTAVKIDDSNRIQGDIHAAAAMWDDAAGEWTLHSGTMRTRGAPGEPAATSPIERLRTRLDPVALLAMSHPRSRYLLSWSQMNRLLADHGQGPLAPLRQLRWARLSHPAANLLAMLIGVCLLLDRDPTGLGRRATAALAASATVWALSMGWIHTPLDGIDPMIAAWAPVAALAPAAASLVRHMNT